MTRERFERLLAVTGPIAPEGMEAFIGDLDCEARELLPADVLKRTLDEYRVPEDKQKRLLAALDAANAVPELVELAHIMAQDAPRALLRCAACEFEAPAPKCLTGFDREAYAFLYTQLCVVEGRKALRRRGVPEIYDRGIPERMTRKQLEKYVKTGDIRFDDYPWDMNFYGCSIFLLDRFYFIPYRWWDEPEAWRDGETGRVTALWRGGVKVRRDGQLDGVNGVFDPMAFETALVETPDSVTGHPVSPEGRVRPDPVTLKKPRWRKVLSKGDYLLALHIPGGEGYTPERVRRSCQLALEFYDRYYPEYSYKGFWSESWLYDPALGDMLGPDRNISRVQRQFYCYPTMEGDEMTRLEVLHDRHADYTRMQARTTLEKALFAAWDRGELRHTTGMFLLREEVPLVGTDPYRREV